LPGLSPVSGKRVEVKFDGGLFATARVMPFDHVLPRNPAQSVRDIAADKLRFIIDPVP